MSDKRTKPKPSPERVALMQWTARLGAVTGEALAEHQASTLAAASARLRAAEHAGLLARHRVLAGHPALFTATAAGLRLSGLSGLGACRVSASGALHMIICARVATALERCYPSSRLQTERELRRDERTSGTPLASACMAADWAGAPALHRPDLVLWPPTGEAELPVAVEVELTVKAPRRLAEICRAWARARGVAGVLYLAAPGVERALERAVATVDACERIVVLPLDALPFSTPGLARGRMLQAAQRTIPSGP